MPSVETFDCVDDAVLWEAVGVNDFDVVKVSAPVAIKVRWNEDLRDSQDSQATKVSITGSISALRVIPLGSLLWHGLLADVPDTLVNIVQLVSDNSGKDVKGRAVRYEYGFAKFINQINLA